MKFHAIFLLLGLLVTGCSHYNQARQDPASHLYLPSIGTTIELLKPLEIPPGHTRVFLQRGEVISKQAFDRYVPNCNFEVRTLSEQVSIIEPEPFLVTKVQRETVEVVQLPIPTVITRLNLAGEYGGHPMIAHGWHFWISSDLQPDVMRMTCRNSFADPWEAQYPSINQMREALGSYVSLKTPE